MANTTTVDLAELRLQVRERADMVNSTFCSDDEIDRYIHASWGELYDLMIESVGPQHFAQSYSATTVAGQSFLSLTSSAGSGEGGVSSPLNIYKILGVDIDIDGTPRPIRAFSLHDRGRWADVTTGWQDHRSVFYRIFTDLDAIRQSKNIVFAPTPQGAHTVHIYYIPTAAQILEDSVAGPFPLTLSYTTILGYAHWEEYIVCDAAAKCLEKEESDASHFYRRIAALRERIVWNANTMDTAEAETVRDVTGGSPLYRGEPREGWSGW